MRPGWWWGQTPGSCCLGSGPAGASQPGHLQGLSSLLAPGISSEPHAPRCSSGDTRATCRAFPSSFAAARSPVTCQLPPRCGPAGSCPHSWEEEVGPGPQSTQEGSSPSCPEPSGRGLPGPPGLSGLLSPRAVSWQRVPPSQDHQDPTPRSRNSFLLTGAPVSPGLSWEPSPPFAPCLLVSLSFLPLLKGLLKMTPSISCCHV